MMYEITVTRSFCTAHALRLADGSFEPVHGHNWQVRLTVAADRLDAIDTVMDFHALEALVDRLVAPACNRNLNDVRPFADRRGRIKVNPSAERVAWWIGSGVADQLPPGVRLSQVCVSEAPGCEARWRPERARSRKSRR